MNSVLPYLGENSGSELDTEFNYVDSRGVAITGISAAMSTTSLHVPSPPQ